MNTGLAQRLRDGTRALHREAEGAGIMPALLAGRLPAALFHALQRNLHPIYLALEAGLSRHAHHAGIAAIATPALARGIHLAADLHSLHGERWRDEVPVFASTRAYVERLQQLEAAEPLGLVAHAYVRYLGDLAGGQTLRRVVAKAFGLKGPDGTRFFDFGPPEQTQALARDFRNGLAAVPVDDTGIDRLVAEAQWAFAQHVRLFTELATSPVS
jgi:heme oxygenase